MLSRKQLEEMGLTKENIDTVLDAHSADVGKIKKELETAQQGLTAAQEQLGERDNQLETLKSTAGDADTLKKQIEQLQTDNKAQAETHAAEVQAMKVTAAIDAALTAAGAKNAKAVKALLNLENAELSKDGAVKGLKEQLEKLQKADDSKFLFETGKAKIKGAAPAQTGVETPDGKVDTSNMSYEELAAYMAENPDAQI